MPLYLLLFVAIIQGVTEFLPVSSSGHLILLPDLTGAQDQGQFIDVSAHVGTLFAVVLYFRKDVAAALIGTGHLIRGRLSTPQAQLALGLVVATIPLVLFGAFLHFTGLSDALRSVKTIAWTMLIFGLVLYWADQKGPEVKDSQIWPIRDAIIMGLCQAIALIPGTSRSGITITGARALGYTREGGARLAMLMSIPAILASGTLLALDVASEGNVEALTDGVIVAVLAFGSALLALTLMMRLLRSVSFTPYVIYRVILGVILLVYAYG
ncbi:MAG: undecaprenyl-diphosphate phosphatase [Paracoccaceae bacterium]